MSNRVADKAKLFNNNIVKFKKYLIISNIYIRDCQEIRIFAKAGLAMGFWVLPMSG
jgi:hypothetical protein